MSDATERELDSVALADMLWNTMQERHKRYAALMSEGNPAARNAIVYAEHVAALFGVPIEHVTINKDGTADVLMPPAPMFSFTIREVSVDGAT